MQGTFRDTQGTPPDPAAHRQLDELAAMAAAGLRDGTLALRHVVGLTDGEMRAIAEVAAQLQDQGRTAEAAQVYGLLIAQDPLDADHWRPLAALQSRLGRHAEAVACYEVLALLADRRAEDTASEARSLRQLGQSPLADEMKRVSRTLAGPRRNTPRGRRIR